MVSLKNTIQQEQNSPRSMSLHAAKSHYYLAAEATQQVQLIILAVNAAFWPVFLAWNPDQKVWSALAAFLIPVFELAVIEPLQKKWKTCGAKIQELFDCAVFKLDWNEFKVGARPREEDIAAGVVRFQKAKGDETIFRDWYNFDFGDIPVSHARLICQRANIWWDTELRGKYISIIRWSICALGLAALVIGIATGFTMEKFILAVLAPISPICIWGIKEVRKQSTIVTDGEHMVCHLDSVWRKVCSGKLTKEELESESRSLQNEIYDRRKGSAVHPQWLYRKKRNEFQRLMVEAANQLLKDYRTLAQSCSHELY